MKKPQFFKRKKADIDKSKSSFSSDLPDHIVILDSEKFYDFILKYPISIIDFWAPWCGPCRMVGPVIEQLAKEMKGKVVFGKLNVDENPQIAAKFSVRSIPTLLLFKDGEAKDQIISDVPKKQIVDKVENLLNL